MKNRKRNRRALRETAGVDPLQVGTVRFFLTAPFYLLTGHLIKLFARLGCRLTDSIRLAVPEQITSDAEIRRRMVIAFELGLPYRSLDDDPGSTIALLQEIKAAETNEEMIAKVDALLASLQPAR